MALLDDARDLHNPPSLNATCEVCGQPATHPICDIQDVGLVNGYMTRKILEKHNFCAEHVREPFYQTTDGKKLSKTEYFNADD